MGKFRTKSVAVEAWSISDLCIAAKFAWHELPKSVIGAYEKGDLVFLDSPPRIRVKTNDGWLGGDIHDMLILQADGDLYPCRGDIFRRDYEAEIDYSKLTNEQLNRIAAGEEPSAVIKWLA